MFIFFARQRMTITPLSNGPLSGNAGLNASSDQMRRDFNRMAFIIDCVAMKITARSGTMFGLILFAQVSLATRMIGHIRAS